MALNPDQPFPKTRGHVIRSKDWNDTVTEVQRLDTAKVNKAGDSVSGSLTVSGNVGVGTTNPQFGRLMLEDAAVPLSLRETGQSPTAGGLWRMPLDAGVLRFDVNTAAAANFSTIVTPLAMTAAGNVGVGTATPNDRLDVAGNLRILTGSNPVRFTEAWSGFPDTATNQAEIANDTGTYKSLMIIGNRSAGLTTPGGGRRVSVWDVLEVNGILRMNYEQDILFRVGPDLNHGIGWYGPYSGGYGKAFAGQFIDGPVLYGFSGGALGTTSGGQRVSITWNSLNRVGINRFNPQFTLHVNGLAVRQDNSSQWSVVSDLRLKQGVETLEGALDKLSRLRGVSFEWKKPEEQGNLTGTQVGLVAQEVEEVLPEWVDESPEGHKTLTIRGFEALVIEAFKELRAENETLRMKNRELEARIATLERAAFGRTREAESVAVVDATEAAVTKARELGVRLSGVEGTGSGGRILVADVEKAAQG
jgi:hypothetical protein